METWKAEVERRIKNWSALYYYIGNNEFGIAIKQIKTENGECPQCGYVHIVVPTPFQQ
jgi:hypothetical protein